MYDLTNLTNATGLYEITTAVNQVSDGYFGMFVLISMFMLTFIVHKRYNDDTATVLFTSAVLNSIIAVMLFGLNLIGNKGIAFSVLLIFVGFMVFKFKEN